jgi:hypothetical protein
VIVLYGLCIDWLAVGYDVMDIVDLSVGFALCRLIVGREHVAIGKHYRRWLVLPLALVLQGLERDVPSIRGYTGMAGYTLAAFALAFAQQSFEGRSHPC